MPTFRNVLKEIGSDKISTNIDVLVVGITGTGKSALVNSILEEKKANESSKGKGCTKTIEKFSLRVGELNVTLIDTVGFQDRNSKEQTAIQEMKNDGQTVSLVLYCIKMGEHRFKNDDEVAMRKLHQAFGSEFFERVIFVLTFANAEDCSVYDDSDDEQDENEEVLLENLKKRFNCRVKERAEEISKFLIENFHIKIKEDRVVPAGFRKKSIHHQQHPLPSNWLYMLLRLCCNEIKDKHHFSRLTLNYKTHFAIIIDNHEGKGSDLQEVLKDLGFSVLYFTQIMKVAATIFVMHKMKLLRLRVSYNL
uniref:AIG1-type G domain-containing protein n=1 Tax=Amphimedon queenslandica TaxID=400682 RepID=A0A1X7T8I3_AMPQE